MTRKMMLIASVAALATTTPALADKPERGGGGKPEQAQAERGGGGGGGGQGQRVEHKQVQRDERQQRSERPQQVERQVQRQEQRVERQERPARIERQQQRIERQVQREQRPERFERQQQRAERQVQRKERPERIERQQQRVERQAQRKERPERIERQQQRVERQAQRKERPERIERQAQRQQSVERQVQRQQLRGERLVTVERKQQPIERSLVDPVFATRDMQPMQSFKTKFADGQTLSIGDRVVSTTYLAPVPTFFSSNYVDTSDYYHRYDNDFGYVYRINRDDGLVSSLMPLFGGYGIGDPWPQTYYSSYVPAGYRDYYYDSPDYFYRNDGNGIYQVDVGTQLITALVSLVMGQSFGVGQALPASYGAYNVPLAYRANYADTDDSWYRYGDGFIYEVDPYSRRVEQRYPLYSDNYYVGEQWPVAYPDYNVPYGYRSAFADSPQHHYRYANGGIYQVDPTNQIILALAALITGDQFAVGQPMPAGYDIYNVPVDYRDRWADSDDEYFRYANGYVYRVDDGTGLIEEAFPVYA